MIKSAAEIRTKTEKNETYRKEIERAIAYQMQRIEQAQSRGLTHTCFSVPYKYEDEIKKLFARKGYSFRPTGYIGGVWQLTENISW